MRKLEVLYITREDLRPTWVDILKIYHTPEDEKVLIAAVYLEGKTLNWF